jgi:uncharacterized Zn-finger protein
MTTKAPEIALTDKTRVTCSGEGGSLGHPAVTLEMGEAGEVQCPYCSRLFVLKSKGE